MLDSRLRTVCLEGCGLCLGLALKRNLSRRSPFSVTSPGSDVLAVAIECDRLHRLVAGLYDRVGGAIGVPEGNAQRIRMGRHVFRACGVVYHDHRVA